MWHRFNLLVIEPSMGGRIILRRNLEKLNYSVDFAWDIESTLTQADTKLYDFILIDEKFDIKIICSKLIEGFQSRSKLNKETPIVFLRSPTRLEKKRDSDCHSFVKPMSEEDTVRLMEFLLELKPLS